MKITRISLYVVLIIMGIIVSVPFIAAFMTSFKQISEIYVSYWALPQGLYLGNYVQAFEVLGSPLMNSFIITIPATLLTVFLGSLGAYGLSKFRFRLSNPYYYLMLASTLIPGHTIIAPIFNLWGSLSLIDTFQGIILIETIFSVPYAVIIMKSFFDQIPQEILDAARIEGCSSISLYWQMIIPMSIPALISAFILEFVYIWNDFLWPLVLTPSGSIQPVTMAVLLMTTRYSTDWGLRAAGAILISIPPLVLFVALQKYFIKGILGGAVVKG